MPMSKRGKPLTSSTSKKKKGYSSNTYSSYDETRAIQPLSERAMATLIEEIGERAVSEMLAENQPACKWAVVRNRAEAAGPKRLIGRWILDFKDQSFYITDWDEDKQEWDATGMAWSNIKEEWYSADFTVTHEAIKEIL